MCNCSESYDCLLCTQRWEVEVCGLVTKQTLRDLSSKFAATLMDDKSPRSLWCTQRQFDPVHPFTDCFFKLHFFVVFSSMQILALKFKIIIFCVYFTFFINISLELVNVNSYDFPYPCEGPRNRPLLYGP
jgi:hypothetical protein